MLGHGWGTITFEHARDRHVIEGVSYLSSPLDDLLCVALHCACGWNTDIVTIFQEPGGYLLRCDWECFDLPPEEQIDALMGRHRKISLYRGRDTDSMIQVTVRDEDVPLWEYVDEDPDQFSRAVLRLADELLTKHGAEGYRALWSPYSTVFPHRAVAALRAALVAVDEERGW